MPAPKYGRMNTKEPGFLSIKDIMTVLGVSKNTANTIMHEFEQRGQVLRLGKIMRVPIPEFQKWLSEKIGSAV